MINVFRICFVCVALIPLATIAQSWDGIGTFNGYAQHLAVDSVNNVLYIGGGFNLIDEELVVQGLCRYDGQTISNIKPNTNLAPFGNNFMTIEAMAFYNGNLYVASHSIKNHGSIEGAPISTQIARFDGENWESVFPEVLNCRSMKVLGDKLYLFSLWYPNSGNDPEFLWEYDGVNLDSFLYESPNEPWAFPQTFGNLHDIIEYDNGYVVAGDMVFNLFYEVPPPYGKDIYFWDGESAVNTNFNGGFMSNSGAPNNVELRTMAWYNGELYVGGYFSAFGNVQGASLVKKGGNNLWYAINNVQGAGFPSGIGIHRLLVFENLLWIVGRLSNFYPEPGQAPTPISEIAIWDGENVFSPSPDVFVDFSQIFDIVPFQNTVYIAGSFSFINVSPITSVARFTGDIPGVNTSVSTFAPPPDFNIHPNPTSSHLTLTGSALLPGSELKVFNVAGQQVYSEVLPYAHETHTLDARRFGPAGLYLLHLNTPGHTPVVKKVVVQE